MNLKNYTTKISASKSIAEIETILMKFGATNIMKTVDTERQIYKQVKFTLDIDGKNVPFMFVSDIEMTAEFLFEKYKSDRKRHTKTLKDFIIPAYNITWRNYKDLIFCQLSFLHIGLLKTEEALVGYLMTGENSILSKKMLDKKFRNKMLPAYEGD